MPRKKQYSRDVPPRITIGTDLTAEAINNYYKVLGMAETAWINGLSPAQRYELVIQDLLAKQEELHSQLEEMED